MSRESGRSPEKAGEGSRENRREQQDRGDRLSDVPSTAERGLVTPDTAAIEVARARAINLSNSPIVLQSELDQLSRESIINKNRKVAEAVIGATIGMSTASTAAVLLGFGKELAVGSLALAGGYAVWKLKWQSLSGIDWFARKLDGLADKLIDKKLPILHWVVNPLVSLLNKSAKALGLDKSLAEHLKKHAADRKKVAEKITKDFLEEEKKAEKKSDDAAKKNARQKKLREVLGEDVAAALEGEFEDLEKAEAAKAVSAPATTPAATPAETPKAT